MTLNSALLNVVKHAYRECLQLFPCTDYIKVLLCIENFSKNLLHSHQTLPSDDRSV